jgi:hypothetical protein
MLCMLIARSSLKLTLSCWWKGRLETQSWLKLYLKRFITSCLDNHCISQHAWIYIPRIFLLSQHRDARFFWVCWDIQCSSRQPVICCALLRKSMCLCIFAWCFFFMWLICIPVCLNECLSKRKVEHFQSEAYKLNMLILIFFSFFFRQGFITDTCSLNTLIATYLPLEQRQELIPIARSGNVVEPKVWPFHW